MWKQTVCCFVVMLVMLTSPSHQEANWPVCGPSSKSTAASPCVLTVTVGSKAIIKCGNTSKEPLTKSSPTKLIDTGAGTTTFCSEKPTSADDACTGKTAGIQYQGTAAVIGSWITIEGNPTRNLAKQETGLSLYGSCTTADGETFFEIKFLPLRLPLPISLTCAVDAAKPTTAADPCLIQVFEEEKGVISCPADATKTGGVFVPANVISSVGKACSQHLLAPAKAGDPPTCSTETPWATVMPDAVIAFGGPASPSPTGLTVTLAVDPDPTFFLGTGYGYCAGASESIYFGAIASRGTSASRTLKIPDDAIYCNSFKDCNQTIKPGQTLIINCTGIATTTEPKKLLDNAAPVFCPTTVAVDAACTDAAGVAFSELGNVINDPYGQFVGVTYTKPDAAANVMAYGYCKDAKAAKSMSFAITFEKGTKPPPTGNPTAPGDPSKPSTPPATDPNTESPTTTSQAAAISSSFLCLIVSAFSALFMSSAIFQ